MTQVVEEPGGIVVVKEIAAPEVIEVSSPGPMGPRGSNAWDEITGKPSTLAGYGITDGAPLSHVGAGGTAHANAVAGGDAGFMAGADKAKLDAVAVGATANSPDATLLARANHTGTQLASTISDFASTTLAAVLAGLSLATGTAITAADTVLSALGKLQKQVTDNLSTYTLAIALKADLASPTFTGTVGVPNLNGGPLAGFRNLLVNGNGAINQRGYVSGTATTIANQCTLDRWRVVTSGQSLTFTASGNGRIMTAPAGGIEQVIEGASIGRTAYVISWVGTATCTVDGVAKTNGAACTLVPGTACTVRFSAGTVSQAQLEPGAIPTPYEDRQGVELLLCQRDYEKSYAQATRPGTAVSFNTMRVFAPLPAITTSYTYGDVRFQVPKRIAPTVITYSAAGTTSTGSNDSGADYAANAASPTYASDTGFHVFNNSAGTLTPAFGAVYLHWVAATGF